MDCTYLLLGAATMYAQMHVHTTCQPKPGSSGTNYLSSTSLNPVSKLPGRRYDYRAYIQKYPGYAPVAKSIKVDLTIPHTPLLQNTTNITRRYVSMSSENVLPNET